MQNYAMSFFQHWRPEWIPKFPPRTICWTFLMSSSMTSQHFVLLPLNLHRTWISWRSFCSTQRADTASIMASMKRDALYSIAFCNVKMHCMIPRCWSKRIYNIFIMEYRSIARILSSSIYSSVWPCLVTMYVQSLLYTCASAVCISWCLAATRKHARRCFALYVCFRH